ncbi:MAG TPA: sigma-54 dependent transcriptional regulator [Phycisphaerae bacterium]|nr:sigma-54 dependent transcriptional regulator [Phycisphaerae bacterium]HOM50453.1 sigma-54 dependent transcriptional regulator [Phycisphaerae bacterium]HON67086.1 sigma-54 dependent transcriptional regulator [Phycisphaerae bacterium]HPP28154.1 sigma-54 dependent transcriptional regulator [Phycisphaerae bacterium]HPZ98516.1 sigma-54 dependent transcriptional regulator [Phycisphaerae bacterium]
MNIRVLIIEDESLIRWSLQQKFQQRGYEVTEAENGEAALEALQAGEYDLIMLDYKLPDMTGLDILRRMRDMGKETVVIMITAFSNIEDAVEAIKLGAFDYVAKPFQMDQLLITVDKALETTQLRRQVRELRSRLQHEFGFDRIIGQHPSMLQLFDVINSVARSSSSTVFLRGETGTGKDLVAGVIHYNSDRAPKPFMNITCTAISETLLESELFGHEKGAFTDARAQKKGLFELADGGTVFLDEVGDMSPTLQAKLLHFLENRRFRRIGGSTEISVDVRVIAATNRDIEEAIKAGQFRKDLLYRLNVVPIFLPPLRERGDDVRLLADHFVSIYSREFKKPITAVQPEAYAKLAGYGWPGNVRELRNVIERAVLLCKEDVLKPADIVLGSGQTASVEDTLAGLDLPPGGLDFDQLENKMLRQALARAAGNQTKAAKLLNLSRDTFRYRLEKHNLL